MYKKGKIYILRSLDTDLVYIGSTVQTLEKIREVQVNNYKKWKNNSSINRKCFEIIKFNNFCIELIEEYPCESKIQLDTREEEIKLKFVNCCNKKKIRAKISVLPSPRQKRDKVYYENNIDRIRERKRLHYHATKLINKAYHEANKVKVTCECGAIVSKSNHTRHKKSLKHLKLISI